MIETDVIIVGAGPAGSTCAWKLKQAGFHVLLVDKHSFPRPKPCAGWITPSVLKDLEVDPNSLDISLTTFRKLTFFIHGRKITIRTRQYAIRRYEFDHWLMERSEARLIKHDVQQITRQDDCFIIDDAFRCTYLIGAAGTNCPVYHTFFKKICPRQRSNLIATIEAEFPYHFTDDRCYLWFFDSDFPGYSWYVPKTGGYLNIGIGGRTADLKRKGETISFHWESFLKKLKKLSLFKNSVIQPRGYSYYLRQRKLTLQIENAYIIGDAAGLATYDMGEGIGPAVRSGLLVAQSICSGKKIAIKKIPRYSFLRILLPWL